PNLWRPISLPQSSANIEPNNGPRLRLRDPSNHLASAIGLLPSFSAFAWGSVPQPICLDLWPAPFRDWLRVSRLPGLIHARPIIPWGSPCMRFGMWVIVLRAALLAA